MRQTRPYPESEHEKQALMKAEVKQRKTKVMKDDRLAEDRTSLQRIPRLYESQGLQINHVDEATSSDRRLSMLRDWYRLIYQHKLLIILVLLLVMPLVIVEAYRNKPIYQATATIEVRKEGSSLKPNDIFSSADYENTRSEAFIIRSRPVLERTVVDLKLAQNPRFLDVNNRRSVWEAIVALKGVDAVQTATVDQAKAKQPTSAEKAKGTEQKPKVDPPDADQNTSAGSETKDGSEKDDRSVMSQAERMQLSPYIGTLSNNLRVESVRETRLLKLSFTHTDPEIAALVSNGVVKNFMDYNFQNKTQHLDEASAWLEDSTRQLKARVTQAEQKLANYSREHNIFSLEGKENLTADKLVRLHDQFMRAETDRLLKQSLYEEVKNGRVERLPEAFADQKTAELRKTLNDLAVQASQLSVRYGAKHPKLIEVRQQMATIQEQLDGNRSRLEEKLKADYDRAVRDESSLKKALNNIKSEAVQQNQASIQYSILQQDLATAKALYTDFLNKTSQANIQRAEQYNNVRLIEVAETPTGPVGPNRMMTILIGFILSLGVGIGLAWLFENLNTKVRTVEDVSRSIPVPILAVIPTLSEDSLRVIRTGLYELKDRSDSARQALDQPAKAVTTEMLKDFSVADEAYRVLRTSVLLSIAGHPPRTILFTSPQTGDGKTSTVVNTAITFTKLEAEVLIIDCDMRKPIIHKIARLEREKGLSTYLSGGGDITEFIKRTPIPHLSILPCGPVPPNPSELISSENMKEMLHKLLDHYKYILIDSSPLFAVTDPVILSTIVDGVILVARSDKSKSEVLRRSLQELTAVRARVLGVILNDFNMRRERHDVYRPYHKRND